MGVVGKSDFKENPMSDLDLDLGFVNYVKIARVVMFFPHICVWLSYQQAKSL